MPVTTLLSVVRFRMSALLRIHRTTRYATYSQRKPRNALKRAQAPKSYGESVTWCQVLTRRSLRRMEQQRDNASLTVSLLTQSRQPSCFHYQGNILDSVVPRFREGTRHRLGDVVGVDRAASQTIPASTRHRQRGRPMDNRIAKGP